MRLRAPIPDLKGPDECIDFAQTVYGLTAKNSYWLDFESPYKREKIDGYDEDRHVECNNRFKIPVRFTRSESRTNHDDVAIVINGFSEPLTFLEGYFDPDYGICPLLNNRNVASAFLPLTFHYWRNPFQGIYAGAPLDQIVDKHKIRFYLGFRQILGDISELASILKRAHSDANTSGQPYTRVHLVGYSLGGLAALSAFVLDRLAGGNLFDSCILICSGVDLQSIGPGVLTAFSISPEQFAEFQEFYTGDHFFERANLDWSDEINSGRLSVFKYLVFGQKPSMTETLVSYVRAYVTLGSSGPKLSARHFESTLEDCAPRIPAIVGLRDNIMVPDKVLHFLPDSSQKFIIRQEGLRHALIFSPKWMDGLARKSVNDVLDYLHMSHQASHR